MIQKKFRSPGDHRPKYFMPSNFFGKYIMASSINFNFLFKDYLQQYFRVVLTVIFQLQITIEVNIHNNIPKKTYSNKVSKKALIFLSSKISRIFIISS